MGQRHYVYGPNLYDPIVDAFNSTYIYGCWFVPWFLILLNVNHKCCYFVFQIKVKMQKL